MKKKHFISGGIAVIFAICAALAYAQTMPPAGTAYPGAGGGTPYTPPSAGGSTGSGGTYSTPPGSDTTAPPPSYAPPPASSPPPTDPSPAQQSGDPTDGVQSYDDGLFSDDSYGFDYAFDFQDLLKKTVTKARKLWRGYSPIEELKIAKNMPFFGTVAGSVWRVLTANNEPVAQGTLIGPGSFLKTIVSLYTGSVYAQFSGKKANWAVSFDTDQSGAQRAGIFNLRGDAFQRTEIPMSEEGGVPYKLALLFHGNTLYGMSDEGSFFMTDQGAMPDENPASWSAVAAPASREPLIPAEKIFELFGAQTGAVANAFFGKVAHAAQAFAGARALDGINADRRGLAALQAVRQKFEAFDFNDPALDYDAVNALVMEYQEGEARIFAIHRQMGRAEPFARGSEWFLEESAASEELMTSTFPGIARFIVSAAAPLDFHVRVADAAGNAKIHSGSCVPAQDELGNPSVSCFMTRVSARGERAIEAANADYFARSGEAYEALAAIERALFAPY